jgi:hypothetical protein
MHVPTEPGALHIWQSVAVPHAELQQTPSAQKPLWQSVANAQPSPSEPLLKSSAVAVNELPDVWPAVTSTLPPVSTTAP